MGQHPGNQHMPPAQGWPANTCLLQMGVAGALDCMCGTALQEAGHVPGQESRLPPSPGGHCASPGFQTSACRVCVRAQPSPKGEASLEEVPSPLPGLGLSFLEAPYGIKAHQRFLGEAEFFFLGAGICTFTQAGRVQLQLRAAAQDTASSSVLPPMDRTDMPGAHLSIPDESKGTLGCVNHSTLVTVLPATPTSGPHLQLCRPKTSPYFRW